MGLRQSRRYAISQQPFLLSSTQYDTIIFIWNQQLSCWITVDLGAWISQVSKYLVIALVLTLPVFNRHIMLNAHNSLEPRARPITVLASFIKCEEGNVPPASNQRPWVPKRSAYQLLYSPDGSPNKLRHVLISWADGNRCSATA
jgi:hypothetical protein